MGIKGKDKRPENPFQKSVKWIPEDGCNGSGREHGYLVELEPGEEPKELGPKWSAAKRASIEMLCVDFSLNEGISVHGFPGERASEIVKDASKKRIQWYHHREKIDVDTFEPGENSTDYTVYRDSVSSYFGKIECRGKIFGELPKVSLFGADRAIEYFSIEIFIGRPPRFTQASAWRAAEPYLGLNSSDYSFLSEQMCVSAFLSPEKFNWILHRLRQRTHYLMIDVDLSGVHGFYSDNSVFQLSPDIKFMDKDTKLENSKDVPVEFWRQFDQEPGIALSFVEEGSVDKYFDKAYPSESGFPRCGV